MEKIHFGAFVLENNKENDFSFAKKAKTI